MNRTVRCEQLASLTDIELQSLVDLMGDVEFAVTSAPTIGMIMSRVHEDAHGEVFNLGEVLVTECQVSVADEEGWAMLLGHREHGARMAALLDAAVTARPELAESVDSTLENLMEQQRQASAARLAGLAATRVQFDVQ